MPACRAARSVAVDVAAREVTAASARGLTVLKTVAPRGCGNHGCGTGLCHVAWQFGVVQTLLPQGPGSWWSGRDSSDHICHARW